MKTNINNKQITLSVLLALPLIVQGYLIDAYIFRIITLSSIVISFLIIVVWYFIINRKLSYIMLMIIVFMGCLLLSTIISDYGNYIRYFYFLITNLGICMLTEILIKKDFKVFCISFLIPISILVIINLISIIVYPNGLSIYKNSFGSENSWFLGFYNGHILILYPAMYLSLLYSYYKKDKADISVAIIILLSIITVFLFWSATSIITVVLFLLFIPILKFYKKATVFNIRNFWIITIICFIAIIIYRVQNYFPYLFENILRRNVTFTGRTSNWERYLFYIQQKIIFGYGFENDIIFELKHGIANAHNLYLEILYLGGIISFIPFVILFVISGYKLMKNKDNKLSFILSFVFFIYSIRFIVESHMTNPRFIFMWFILAYHIDVIIEQYETKNCKRQISC